MGKISNKDIIDYIESNIRDFHKKRLDNLLALKLNNVLKRKNPYLFKAKNIITTLELVKTILDAHLSSQEEGIFGGFLEGLAIFINSKVFKGKKSTAEGIDLEFEKRGFKYIVSIKSGPNWGNSQQVKRMKDNFKQAKRILGTTSSKINVIAVNGCCYGKDDNPNKGDYLKLCGQRFWKFISGNEKLYTEIIEPLGHKAKQNNEDFQMEYSKVINKFTLAFGKEYCDDDGNILWNDLVKLNSGIKKNPELDY